jgi:hypothetical protein
MTAEYLSSYDRRVLLVSDALKEHSTLGDKAAKGLAIHVLEVLDHIPENVR